jgi:secreted protein with Ig-like and vWFA domain
LQIEAYPIHQDTTLSEESEKIKICASILESWTKMDKEDFKATILDKSAASKV